MPTRAPSRALLALAFAASLAGCPTTGPGGRELGIVDGTRELGEPGVVLVQGVLGLCTGTLISDRVVLTAKHCVINRGAAAPAPPSFFSVGVGSSSSDVTPYRVREVLTTPGAFFGSAITDGSDIALLVLRAPVPGVTPIAVRREAPTDLVGREVTAIGFGTTPAGEIGVKYRTTTTLRSVTGQVLTAQNAICQGDSGGPIILEAAGGAPREIVGVASYGQSVGPTATCPASLDAWNRVDLLRALIDRAILRAGGCVETGDEVCNSLDDDCDGETDEGCAALGEACAVDADCAFAALPEGLADDAPPPVVCAETSAGRRCSAPCDPLDPVGGCASLEVAFGAAPRPLEGFLCASVGGCEGRCVRGTPGTAGEGAACDDHAACASGRCEGGRCATPCLGGAGSCPEGEVCGADAGACGVCAAPATRPSGRAVGEPCDDPAQCAGLTCGTLDGEALCTTACTDDAPCGPGARCASGWCSPGPRAELYGACRLDADCGGGACIPWGSTSVCSIPCADAAACAGGRCEPVDGATRCVPSAPVLGEACTDACAQGACVDGACRLRCGGGRPCAIGERCVREGGDAVCRPRPAPAGGCSVGLAGPVGSPLGVGLAALAALAARLRRRAARR